MLTDLMKKSLTSIGLKRDETKFEFSVNDGSSYDNFLPS